MTIDKQLDELVPFLMDVRRSIHCHPELGFKEIRTSGIVRRVLEECGAEFKDGIARTGITGLIKGDQPGPVIGIRLDLDAIAVTDEKTVCYRSAVDGLAHACGHDVHTAIGLGLAKIMTMNRADICGAVKLIFQPAEEVPFEQTFAEFDRYREAPSGRRGAAIAVEDGVLTDPNVDKLLGFHCWPELPAGTIGYQAGASMAGTGNFHLEITGSGGHAATPHLTVDPIVVSAQVVGALQTLASRRIKPGTPFVLTIGTIRGGVRRSVIARSVDMTGTVRANDWELLQTIVPAEMERLIKGITQASGAAYTFNYAVDVPPVINNDALLQETAQILKEQLGQQVVEMKEHCMTADDFAFLAQVVPAVYLKLGTGGPDSRTRHSLHSPLFDVDESCLVFGVKSLYNLICEIGRKKHD